jgi:PAS domain S-box-containing protein
MQDKQKDLFESRFQRLRTENKELKEKLAYQKKDNINALKSLARNERLLNAMPAGFIIIQDKKILKANDTLLSYLGYRTEDITGADFLDFIHADDNDHVKKIHQSWNSGRMSPDQYDARLVTASGMPVVFNIRCKRIRFQNRTAFLLILNGLTERLEQGREKTMENKTEALIAMAAGVNDKLGPFNHIILETIKGYKAGLHSGNKKPDEIFERLEDLTIKALEPIEKLAIIASRDRGKQVSLPFNLNDAVKGAVQSANRICREWSESRGIKIALKTYLRSSSLIEGDLKGITDAIFHIINNALEAMPEGGDIHITTEDNNGDCHIYIQDSGTGIPDRFMDRIFDPFFTTKAGAMGLGLSMTCSIVKRHGGDIEVESRDGEGTIFHIRFPLTGQRAISAPRGCRKKITDSQILIIQESDVARELFSHALKIKGCGITKVNNALQGLDKLKKKSFDMVIADETALNMKRHLFIEKARKIMPGLSIALITSDKADPDASPSCGHEADLHIRKPIDVNLAVKRISGILTARQ